MAEKPIRVLMIDDDESDFVLVNELLTSLEQPRYEVKWARNFAHAVPEIRGGRHDIYLVDYRLEGRSGLDLLRQYLDNGRKGPVIIFTGHGSRETDIEAIESGASAFLLKGKVNAEELDRVIRYSISGYQSKESQEGNESAGCSTVSFIGAKGGVGTTSVAVNIAVSAAARGRKVSLIDLRPGPGAMADQLELPAHWDLGALLRLDPKHIDARALSRVMTRHSSGVRVVTAPANVADYKEINPACVDAIIKAARENADLLILDLPCEASEANRKALQESDFVGLVLEREANSILAAVMTRRLFDSWKITTPVGAIVV